MFQELIAESITKEDDGKTSGNGKN
jgi:hypothetical protein